MREMLLFGLQMKVESVNKIYYSVQKETELFLNSAPTSIESELRLLTAPSVRF
jgi:hypothetical protein